MIMMTITIITISDFASRSTYVNASSAQPSPKYRKCTLNERRNTDFPTQYRISVICSAGEERRERENKGSSMSYWAFNDLMSEEYTELEKSRLIRKCILEEIITLASSALCTS